MSRSGHALSCHATHTVSHTLGATAAFLASSLNARSLINPAHQPLFFFWLGWHATRTRDTQRASVTARELPFHCVHREVARRVPRGGRARRGCVRSAPRPAWPYRPRPPAAAITVNLHAAPSRPSRPHAGPGGRASSRQQQVNKSSNNHNNSAIPPLSARARGSVASPPGSQVTLATLAEAPRHRSSTAADPARTPRTLRLYLGCIRTGGSPPGLQAGTKPVTSPPWSTSRSSRDEQR